MTELPSTASIIDGRYRLLGRIGSGGMADVVCAEDLQLGRKVAIKLLHRRFAEDAEFVERFRREASAAAGLQHPNVVAVYDRGAWDGTYYIAMEFLDGRSLKKLIQDEAPLAPDRAIELTTQILKAARFAHRRGIIHRDLKPHNVIVDEQRPTPHLKVADFGIAKAGASDMTQTGSIMGTAQYLSPEQAQGLAVSAASDLYAVGIILYEMLTGRVPFDGESAVTIALKQVGEAPVPPSVVNPQVPPALEAVVLRALEKDPADRFGDADAFIAALADAAAGIAPGPPTGEATRVIAPPRAGTGRFVPVPPPDAYREPLPPVQPPPLAPPEPDEGGGGRWWIALLVGLVVAAVIVGALLLLGHDKVRVPSVVGRSQNDAERALERQGLSSDVTQRASQDQPSGTVIAQDPGGGAKTDKGAVVRLVVSSGPAMATIPNLAGQPRSVARKALLDRGFKIAERREPSETVSENRVIATDPGAGDDLQKDQTVTLVISSGAERLTVPSVVGLSEAEARSALGQAGFKVATTSRETEDEDPGTVLEQSPTPQARLRKGGTVTLVLAKAPPDVEVPDVTGQGQNAATQALRKAGFTVQTLTQPVDNLDQDRHVLAQDPPGGKAKKGSTVTITVGHFDPALNPDPGTGTTPSVSTPTPADPTAPTA